MGSDPAPQPPSVPPMMVGFSKEETLRAEVWVQAHLRACNSNLIPAVVRRRGDADAGSVLIKHWRGNSDCTVYSRVIWPEGGSGWLRATGTEPVSEPEADEFIARRVARDPDLWVLEIEDLKDRYVLSDIIE